ncbi:unnamed protein product [Amoebophrya sp. A25]|nr:unnamed protein product [Amoebophrya sp. A25]|eukprot:GSA25T00016420001.1
MSLPIQVDDHIQPDGPAGLGMGKPSRSFGEILRDYDAMSAESGLDDELMRTPPTMTREPLEVVVEGETSLEARLLTNAKSKPAPSSTGPSLAELELAERELRDFVKGPNQSWRQLCEAERKRWTAAELEIRRLEDQALQVRNENERKAALRQHVAEARERASLIVAEYEAQLETLKDRYETRICEIQNERKLAAG